MKFMLPFLIMILLVGCGEKQPLENSLEEASYVQNPETESEYVYKEDEDTKEESLTLNEFRTSKGNTIMIENFDDQEFIESPLVLRGMVPSSWVFEGVFPVILTTDKGEVLREWYATADQFDEKGDYLEGLLIFNLHIDFLKPLPEKAEFGVLRFSKNVVTEDDTQDIIDINVLFDK